MEDAKKKKISQACWLIFLGEGIKLVVALLYASSLEGVLASAVGGALMLAGLFLLRKEHPAYGRALYLGEGQLVFALGGGLMGESLLATIVTLIGQLLFVGEIFFFGLAMEELLKGKGKIELAKRCLMIRQMFLIYVVVNVAGVVFSIVPLFQDAASVALTFTALFWIVASGTFLIFLTQCAKAVQE
ncbi:MAG: hypothetical protein HFF05_02115 [Oscillospiraceae bacterium]|nr:hypothetical protein [Oscillospiraceae bacterium]